MLTHLEPVLKFLYRDRIEQQVSTAFGREEVLKGILGLESVWRTKKSPACAGLPLFKTACAV